MSEDKNVNKKSFWKGMKSELKKVIWPTREQTFKSTFATIAFVIMISLVLIVFNLFFNWLSNLWIRSLSHEDIINNIVISSGDETKNEENNAISGEVIPNVEEIGEEIQNDENVFETVESGEVEPVSDTTEE